MTENEDNRIEREENDPRNEPEREADRKIEALETELASLQAGVQVIIERLRPSWCKGQLEKLTIGDEGLDLDYLIRTWGGNLLSVKICGKGGRIHGSHTVELYTFDPRRHGKILRAPNRNEDDEDIAPAPLMAPQPEIALFPKMLEMMEAQRQSEMETLRAILLAQNQSAPAPAPAFGGVGELLKMAGAFNQLKDMFRTEQPLATAEEAFPAQIMDMAKMFLESKREPRPRLVPPTTGPNEGPGAPPLRRMPARPIENPNVTPLRGADDIVSQISAMDPNLAADTLITALGQMPGNRQEETIAAFMERFQDTMPDYFEEDDDSEGVREK